MIGPSLDAALVTLYERLDDATLSPEERLIAVVCAGERLRVVLRDVVVEMLLNIISQSDQLWALELEHDGGSLSVRGWVDGEGRSHLDPRTDPRKQIPAEGMRYWERLDQLAAHLSLGDSDLPPFIPGTRSGTVLLPNPA